MPRRGACQFAEPKIDLDKLRALQGQRRPEADRRSRPGVEAAQGHLHPGPRVVRGRQDAQSIELVKGGTETLTFEHAIIATGSRPATVPGVSIDSPRVMDSTGALDLPDIPKSLLVVGGGYIGLELGSVYAALGTKVTVVEMTPACCQAPIAIWSTS